RVVRRDQRSAGVERQGGRLRAKGDAEPLGEPCHDVAVSVLDHAAQGATARRHAQRTAAVAGSLPPPYTGAMHPTKNDLPERTRTGVVDLLAPHVASAIDLMLQAKHAHWNVKGPNFIALHELFDKVAATAQKHADGLAERIAQLGGRPS